MQYYMIQYQNEGMDEPWMVILELDEQNCIQRQIDCYRIGGLQEPKVVHADTPTDVKALVGKDDTIIPLDQPRFEALWAEAYNMPNDVMELFS